MNGRMKKRVLSFYMAAVLALEMLFTGVVPVLAAGAAPSLSVTPGLGGSVGGGVSVTAAVSGDDSTATLSLYVPSSYNAGSEILGVSRTEADAYPADAVIQYLYDNSYALSAFAWDCYTTVWDAEAGVNYTFTASEDVPVIAVLSAGGTETVGASAAASGYVISTGGFTGTPYDTDFVIDIGQMTSTAEYADKGPNTVQSGDNFQVVLPVEASSTSNNMPDSVKVVYTIPNAEWINASHFAEAASAASGVIDVSLLEGSNKIVMTITDFKTKLAGSAFSIVLPVQFNNGVIANESDCDFSVAIYDAADTGFTTNLIDTDAHAAGYDEVSVKVFSGIEWAANPPAFASGSKVYPPVFNSEIFVKLMPEDTGAGGVFNTVTFSADNKMGYSSVTGQSEIGTLYTGEVELTGTLYVPAYMFSGAPAETVKSKISDYFVIENADSVQVEVTEVARNLSDIGSDYFDTPTDYYKVTFTWTVENGSTTADMRAVSASVGMKNLIIPTKSGAASQIFSDGGSKITTDFGGVILAETSVDYTAVDGATTGEAVSVEKNVQYKVSQYPSSPVWNLTAPQDFSKTTTTPMLVESQGTFSFTLDGIGNPSVSTGSSNYASPYKSLVVYDGLINGLSDEEQVFKNFELLSVSTGSYTLDNAALMDKYSGMKVTVYYTRDSNPFTLTDGKMAESGGVDWKKLDEYPLFVNGEPAASMTIPFSESDVTGIKYVFTNSDAFVGNTIPAGLTAVESPELTFTNNTSKAVVEYNNYAMLEYAGMDSVKAYRYDDATVVPQKDDWYYLSLNKTAANASRPSADGYLYPGDTARYTLSMENRTTIDVSLKNFDVIDLPDARYGIGAWIGKTSSELKALLQSPSVWIIGTGGERIPASGSIGYDVSVAHEDGKYVLKFAFTNDADVLKSGQTLHVSYKLNLPLNVYESNKEPVQNTFWTRWKGPGPGDFHFFGSGMCEFFKTELMPVIGLSKTVNNRKLSYAPGDYVDYTIKVTNIGGNFSPSDFSGDDFVVKDIFSTSNFILDEDVIKDSLVVKYNGEPLDESKYTVSVDGLEYDDGSVGDGTYAAGHQTFNIALNRADYLKADSTLTISFQVQLGNEIADANTTENKGKLYFGTAGAVTATNSTYLFLEPTKAVEFHRAEGTRLDTAVKDIRTVGTTEYDLGKTNALRATVSVTVQRPGAVLGLEKDVLRIQTNGDDAFIQYRVRLTNLGENDFQMPNDSFSSGVLLSQFRDRLPKTQTIFADAAHPAVGTYHAAGSSYELCKYTNTEQFSKELEEADGANGQLVGLFTPTWGTAPSGAGQANDSRPRLKPNESYTFTYWATAKKADITEGDEYVNEAGYLLYGNDDEVTVGIVDGETVGMLFDSADGKSGAFGKAVTGTMDQWGARQYLYAQAKMQFDWSSVTPTITKTRVNVSGKTVTKNNANSYEIGDNVYWLLTIENESTNGAALKPGFTVYDALPDGLVYDDSFTPVAYSGGLKTYGDSVELDVFTESDMLLSWSVDEAALLQLLGSDGLQQGDVLSILFATKADYYGTHDNVSYLTLADGQTMDIPAKYDNVYLLADEGFAAFGVRKESVFAAENAKVFGTYNISSYKTVEHVERTDNDLASGRYSDSEYITVLPGEVFKYSLHVYTEHASASFGQIVLIDVLPGVGDYGVIAQKQARGSEWQPRFAADPAFTLSVGGVPLAYGTQFVVEYSDKVGDKTAGSVLTKDDWDVNNKDGWTVWDGVGLIGGLQAKSIRFRVIDGAVKIDKDNALVATYNMVAPVLDSAVTPKTAVAGETAWGSFGYAMSPNGSTLLRAEPMRVGVTPAAVEIEIEKSFTGGVAGFAGVKLVLNRIALGGAEETVYTIGGSGIAGKDVLLGDDGKTGLFLVLPGTYILRETAGPIGFALASVTVAGASMMNKSFTLDVQEPGEGAVKIQVVNKANDTPNPPNPPGGDPEPTTSPDPEPTTSPDPEPTTSPDPEPTATPDPEPTATPDPEPTATPDPDAPPRFKPANLPDGYTVEQISDNEFMVFDEFGVPLGTILVPEGMSIDDMFLDDMMPLGGFKINPSTGDAGAMMNVISIVLPVAGLLLCLRLRRRMRDEK